MTTVVNNVMCAGPVDNEPHCSDLSMLPGSGITGVAMPVVKLAEARSSDVAVLHHHTVDDIALVVQLEPDESTAERSASQ